MAQAEQLSASLEDYLEAIFNIISKKGGVRAKDIAKYLGVKAGSVTVALQSLAKTKHVNYQPYDVITLTAKGLVEAKEIIRKHEVLRDFFVQILGAKDSIAEEGACKMEHVIPDELLEKLIAFTEFIQACPRCGTDWIKQFHKKCNSAVSGSNNSCKECIDDGIASLKKEKHKMTNQVRQATLVDIPSGNKCIVKNIKKKASVTKRLIEMGVGKGGLIEVERIAPLGDPIEVKVKGYHLSLRKEEAENIEVEAQ